ncbi:glutamine-hydrolyzing carbamoyl-phosphate synthase small subunit [Anaplasmataceae bacterium AB001_6]|nr:glutamine-hydrolyzing carbamoyl-phosphate synthase small subunit [Anaplasmataceae bacterium AB001_6]
MIYSACNNQFVDSFIQFSDGSREECFALEGFTESIIGELCFTTGMSGYQHSITDPSFANQILVFSTSHIGNIGINYLDNESRLPFIKCVVLDNEPFTGFHYQSYTSMVKFLSEKKIAVLVGANTRRLVRYIRSNPASSVFVAMGEKAYNTTVTDAQKSIMDYGNVTGFDMAAECTSDHVETYESYDSNSQIRIAVIDFGAKDGIVRSLRDFANVHVFPSKEGLYETLLEDKFDGIVLSNGPGDPSKTFENLQDDLCKIIDDERWVIFGICLGHQIIGIRYGAKCEKMFVGHRGSNHPVVCLNSNRSFITSQNHGFAILSEGLDDSQIEITHSSLIDNSIEGIRSRDGRIFSVQYHPEANPGTYDVLFLFEQLKDEINNR